MTQRTVHTSAIVVLSVGLALGACAPVVNGPKQAVSYEETHPISVDTDVVSLMVSPSENDGNLSARSRLEVKSFLMNYKTRGHGPVSITKPSSGADQGDATRASRTIAALADELGIGDAFIAQTAYSPEEGQSDAPVILSFMRYVATAPACGDWSGDVAKTFGNTRTRNFGCAHQNNLAAMVLDPRDLITPRSLGPADQGRRQTVLEGYRSGQSTATERTETESGQVSEVE